jgi:hypothetical protein
MKAFAKVKRSSAMFVAALACAMLAGPVPALAQTNTAKAVSAVTIVSGGSILQFTTTSFQNMPGGVAVIKVPVDKVQLVEARITASSSCQGPSGQNWCAVRILADGVEMNPVIPGGTAFDGVGDGNDYFEGHAMQRSILLGPGSHVIQVQAAVSLSGMSFFLDDWSFTVTQYNKGK